jgi:DNA repair protein SbcD/Mre11
MAFRFLHAADIHLDSPLLALEEYPGAPLAEIRLATRRALANLVDLALEEAVDFVVIAGDLFDGEWRDCNTGLHFVSEMSRLRPAGIPVYIALGNHDAASRLTLNLPWGGHVHFFDHRHPERIDLPHLGAALFGQSFRTQHVEDDLTATFPVGDPGRCNIGVLHTSATGDPNHPVYAPCSLDGLRSRHYQYWALGHIHARAELARDPWIVFPGNIQGRSVRECGPRGCYLVTMDDRGAATLAFRELDVVRWEVVRIALDDTLTGDLVTLAEPAVDRAAAASGGRTLALRIALDGYGPAWNAAAADPVGALARLRAMAQNLAVPIHIEKLRLESHPPAAHPDLDAAEGPLGELRALAREFAASGTLLAQLGAEFDDLAGKVSAIVRPDGNVLDPRDPALLREALASAEALLMGGENTRAAGAGNRGASR